MGRDTLKDTLYVTDLDGTLLNSSSVVSPRTAALLNRAIDAGAQFTVATARTPATVIPLMRDVGLRLPAVVMTGATIWDFATSRFMYPKFLDENTVDALFREYRRFGVPMFAYFLHDDTHLHIYHYGARLSEAERQFMEQRSHSPLKKFIVPPDGESPLPPDMSRALLFFTICPDPAPRQLSVMIAADYPAATPVYYHEGDSPLAELEVFNAETSKAEAIKRIARHAGVKRIVAFGDNMNDIPMLRAADVAVAVGNAVPEVKAIADVVIDSHDNDAVARFIIDDIKHQP